MKIYFTRHGETTRNAERRISGRVDVPLSELGRRQAEALAARIRAEGLHIDLIISSPMKRARDTADAAAAVTGAPVTVDARLIEQDYGEYEGVYMDEPRFSEFLENKRHFAYRYPGGESMLDVAARVFPFLDELIRMHADKTVLIVSHGGVSRLFNAYFCDMTNDEYYNFLPDNCELTLYETEAPRCCAL